MKTILYIGLGHLGNIFYDLYHSKYKIIGTKRKNKQKSSNIITYDMGQQQLPQVDCDYVVFSTPPNSDLLHSIDSFHRHLPINVVFILISSTSVYPMNKVNEDSECEPQNDRAKILINAEKLLMGLKRDYLILRPGGLVDDKRHPKFFLRSPSYKEGSLNFVHTKDVASFIAFCVEKNIVNQIFNLVSSDHPLKSEIYPQIANVQVEAHSDELKVVSNQKSKDTGFCYEFDNIQTFLGA